MLTPIPLPTNQPPRFYAGGELIAQFRGIPFVGGPRPEDWIASTTTLAGEGDLGLSALPDGRLLRDAIAADPISWLGTDHVARYGKDPQLLVKLLNTSQRLPVHAHPDDEFAAQWLGRPHGKAEAWHILVGGSLYLGLRDEVSLEHLSDLVQQQRTEELLSLLNRVDVKPGETVFVPPGTLHSIGPGILLAEVQQPEDLSILIDWRDYDVDLSRRGHLGLGFSRALHAIDRHGWDAQRLHELVAAPEAPNRLPDEAAAFFRIDRVGPGGEAALPRGYAVIIVTGGTLELRNDDGESVIAPRGTTLVQPDAAGDLAVLGEGEALVFRPPAP